MSTVGFVGPLPPIRSGIAQHSAQLVRALEAAGHPVVAHSWAAQYPRLLYPRSQIDPAAPSHPGATRRLRWWEPGGWVRIGRALRTVDRLVMPWTVPVHAPPQLAMMKAAAVPTTIVVHNALPHEPMPGAEALARTVLRRADLLVAHAASEAERCAELAPHVPVVVVAHPPNQAPVVRPLPDGPIRLLCQGFVRDYKGFDLAVRSLPELRRRHPGVTLTIAGEPWDGDRARWHRLVADLGVSEHVDLRLGYVSDEDVVQLIADHHLLVAPYRHATQSGVVVQALAAGRPVVATRVGGLPDMVVDGSNGTLAEPGDVRSLEDAVSTAIADLDALAGQAAATVTPWRDVAAAVVGDQRTPNAAATSLRKRSGSAAITVR